MIKYSHMSETESQYESCPKVLTRFTRADKKCKTIVSTYFGAGQAAGLGAGNSIFTKSGSLLRAFANEPGETGETRGNCRSEDKCRIKKV